jgi:acetyltransferase-like isoleucine patch superfamily enzyme
MDIIGGIVSRLRALRWKLSGVRMRGAIWLRAVEIPRGHRRITLGDGVALDRGVTLLITGRGSIEIGDRCYLNRHAFIDASERIEIGRGAMIGPFAYITDHDHDRKDPARGELVSVPTRVGEGAWIGAHATILKGVEIGAGAVVGAGSVVTRPVEPGTVVAGNPARVLRATDAG